MQIERRFFFVALAGVAHQCGAETTYTYQSYRDLLVQVEDSAKFTGEVGYLITNALLAKLPEPAQIFRTNAGLTPAWSPNSWEEISLTSGSRLHLFQDPQVEGRRRITASEILLHRIASLLSTSDCSLHGNAPSGVICRCPLEALFSAIASTPSSFITTFLTMIGLPPQDGGCPIELLKQRDKQLMGKGKGEKDRHEIGPVQHLRAET